MVMGVHVYSIGVKDSRVRTHYTTFEQAHDTVRTLHAWVPLLTIEMCLLQFATEIVFTFFFKDSF